MAIAMLSLTDCANLLVYEQAKENIYYYCAFFKKKGNYISNFLNENYDLLVLTLHLMASSM